MPYGLLSELQFLQETSGEWLGNLTYLEILLYLENILENFEKA